MNLFQNKNRKKDTRDQKLKGGGGWFGGGGGGGVLLFKKNSHFFVSRRIYMGVALLYSSQPKDFIVIPHIIARNRQRWI